MAQKLLRRRHRQTTIPIVLSFFLVWQGPIFVPTVAKETASDFYNCVERPEPLTEWSLDLQNELRQSFRNSMTKCNVVH